MSTKPKYLNRPSPPRPANDVACRGKSFPGNDGGVWKSEQTSTGAYRWKRVGERVAKRSVSKRSVSKRSVSKRSASKRSASKRSAKRSAKLQLSIRKVSELKIILSKCGQKVSGTKNELIERIRSNCMTKNNKSLKNICK